MATRLALPTLVLVLVSAASFGTQQERALGPSRVRIYFSVLDKQEKPVPGLSADKFELRLNGKRTDLEGFRPGLAHTDRSIPLVLWILIDWNPNVSAEMMRRQGDAAAKAFTLFNPDSAIGVKLVSDRSETLQPLAHDPAGLHRAFAEFSRRRGMLRVGAGEDSVEVGAGGILGAAEYAIDELVNFSLADPALKGREVHRAIMILSDGNVNPNYGKKPLYEKAGVENVFLYPVFVPRSGPYGLWV
ncbi:MAG TPA: hypothetical protein VE398_20415, partial [Acidobacteriota bacterium]|nr:hypothetical protein [Acidobacteriota bacterium]